MKKMFLVAYLCAFSLIGLMSMNEENQSQEEEKKEEEKKEEEKKEEEKKEEEKKEEEKKEEEKKEEEKKEEEKKLVTTIKNLQTEIMTMARDAKSKLNFANYLQNYVDAQKPWKERINKKAGKAWKATKAGWEKIKENPGKTAAVVGGLAAGYFFREGIAQNIGKLKNFSGGKVSSAWEYAREIPGKVKGKFKKR